MNFARCLALIAVSVAVTAPPAQAAEVYRGTIVVTDAGTSHNLLPLDGGSFAIPNYSRITVQPTAAAYVCVEELTDAGAPFCSATKGVKVAQDEKFPSSCQAQHYSLMADGGLVTGCVVTIMPVSGTSVSAPVWTRGENGAPNEGR